MSWRGLDHRTIYEMVVHGGQGPGVSQDTETRWSRVQGVISDAEHAIAAAVRAGESEWEGGGGDAMRTAYTPLGAWALNAAVSAHITATGVRGQAELAMNTRMHVADNAPPESFGSWDGHTIYDEQAAAVDRLMADYETASAENERRFDTWSVPPTVVVTPATIGVNGPGGSGAGPLPDTGISPAGGGTGSGGVGSGGVGSGGASAPVGGTPSASAIGGSVAPNPGVGGVVPPAGGGVGGGSAVPPATGRAGVGGASNAVAPGAPGHGVAATLGTGAAATPGTGVAPKPGAGVAVTPGAVGRGVATMPGTGGIARPADRPPGSPGGSGSGPGPWSRAAGTSPVQPVVPAVPPRGPNPDWRSVLLPPERGAPASGETTTRPSGPGSVGGPSTQAQTGGTQGATRAGGLGGLAMYPPMAGAGGGAPGEGRPRPSYLLDDCGAFADRRWVCPAVITPDDPR